MKTLTDISAVVMPPRIQALPKDHRGYPIPHGVLWTDGVPDFRVIDGNKWQEAIGKRACGICGTTMGKSVAFVGGRISLKNRMFTDLPMHAECAIYALQVCPFLAMRKFGYLDRGDDEKHEVNNLVSTTRPEVFGLGITEKYKVLNLGDGGLGIKAGLFKSITMWRHGSQVDSWEPE